MSIQAHSHEAEITRESLCKTKGTDVYFLRVFGADFGTPEIADRYVKVWREQDGVDLFTIDDPLDQGGLELRDMYLFRIRAKRINVWLTAGDLWKLRLN